MYLGGDKNMKDPIRTNLCPACRSKYDAGEQQYLCSQCAKMFEPTANSNSKAQGEGQSL